MKKGLLALGALFAICLSMLATDMVVKQKNGEDWKINVDDVEEVFFEENAIIPDDSILVETSKKFLIFKILSDSTAEVIGLRRGLGAELIIPAKVRIDGVLYKVTSIGEGAIDLNKELTSIYIQDGVTSIGAWAFQNCSSLTNINIPKGVSSIGTSAFWGCNSLTSINIPEGVSSIGTSAFWDCSSLANINIPESVTNIGATAFYGCSSLGNINIPESVTSIGNSAFSGCNNLNVVINNSKDNVEVGEDAFEGCKSVTYLK